MNVKFNMIKTELLIPPPPGPNLLLVHSSNLHPAAQDKNLETILDAPLHIHSEPVRQSY